MRTDHYDSTPMTPEDAAAYLRAFGNRQYDWIAEDCEAEVAPNVWAALGLVPFRHGGIIGNARPGSSFNNHSNVRPSDGWKRDGGHYCLYPSNGTGGTTNATALPAASNRKMSILANQRAVQMNARGAMSRAAAQEAFIKNGMTSKPPNVITAETVNYQVEVTASPTLNIRSEPSTAKRELTVVDTVRTGTHLDIDRTIDGHDHTAPNGTTLWGRINGGKYNHMWIALRHTKRTNNHPETPQPTVPWSVQVLASRDSVDVDRQIARLRGMGYHDAFINVSNGWHRARVPAGTEQQARALFPVLRSKGFTDAFPVQN